MFTAFLTFALLTVTDPSVGPAAAAALSAPTSALYRNLAPFDLQEVAVLDSETLELRIQLGSYANPLGLANGFSHPIIEIYLGSSESTGVSELLPGSGLVLPDGETWTYALQLTGDHALGYQATAAGPVEFSPELQLIDDHLYVMTGQPPIAEPRVAAITGLYSPFHEDGWRPLSPTPSPWAFSSDEQRFPVVDVLALTEEAQLSALSGGVLPVTEVNTIPNPNTMWFALMAAGIGLAGVGLILRGFSRPAAEPVLAESEEDDAELPPADSGPAAVATDVAAEPVTEETEPAAAVAAEPEPAEADPDEPEPPRVGLFRGSADTAPAATVSAAQATLPRDEAEQLSDQEPELPAPTVAADDDYALPELGSIDFGEFGDEQTPAEVAETEDADPSQPAASDSDKREGPVS